ncbi:MAG: DHH family phosphoesterase [Actinomycetota bacterium]
MKSDSFPDLIPAGRILAEANEIVMACHVGPDGDALGSMLAVAYAGSQAGKKVLPSFGPPFGTTPNYRFLPTDLLVPPSQIPEEPEVMVSFDSGNIERLGGLGGPATRAKTLIVVDHHGAGSDGFGHLNLIDANAAATAEIAHLLIGAAGWTVDVRVATCLLTGLVTDTGRFQYSNTRPETLRLAADLVDAGARPDVIGRHIYDETPFGYLEVAGAVLKRAILDEPRKLVWTVLYRGDLERAGLGLADTDPLIDLVRLPIEAEAALLLKEQDDGLFKGSLRSRGEFDVGGIAQALGGGGHHNAAGFTFRGSAEQAVNAVTELLDQ